MIFKNQYLALHKVSCLITDCDVRHYTTHGPNPLWTELTFLGRFTLYGTARHDEIFFCGFHMLEFTLVGHRQLTTKTASLGLREENNLSVC
jgi:hypothetical protein